MASPEPKTKTYDDWSGGNWGADGSVNAGLMTPFKYRALNLQVYANGSLGPRPGWKALTTSGTPPATINASDYWSAVWLPRPNTTSGMVLFVARTTAAATVRLNMDDGAFQTSVLGGITTGVEGALETNPGNFTFINPQTVVVGAARWYNPHTNAAATTITYPSSFAPTHTVFYKDRLYAWGDSTYQNRVYYSDFGTFDTFSAGNYFDINVGSATSTTRPRIRASWVVKDVLMFLVTTGDINQIDAFGEIWALQGPNAITGSLSRIGKGRVPLYGSLATPHHEVVVGMDHSFSRGGVILSPAGIETKTLDKIRPGNDIYQFSAGRNPVSSYGEDSLIMPFIVKATYDTSSTGPEIRERAVGDYAERGLQAWALVHGVWTKEIWWSGATEITVTQLPSASNFLYATLPFAGNKLIAITNDTTDLTGTWRFHTRDICLDRPSTTTDTWSNAQEAHADVESTELGCQLWLPEEMAPIGHGVRVRRVIVEYDYWKTSSFYPASTADFSCKVRYRGQTDSATLDTDTLGGADGSFDYLADTTGVYPGRGRKVFSFPEAGWSGSYQIIFPEIRNVAFRKVTVQYEQKLVES